MRVATRHHTSKRSARETVEGQLPGLVARFGQSVSDPTYRWQGDTLEFAFRAVGADLTGTLEVTDTELLLDVNVPFRFMLFEGKIKSEAQAWCDQIFGAAG